MDNRTVEERFLSKFVIDPLTGCWNWTACKDKDGYGLISIDYKLVRATRYSHKRSKGPVDGYLVCHTCDNPSCVNPDHLWLGKTCDNFADMRRKRRSCSGSRNRNSKLTYQQVCEIRASKEHWSVVIKKYGINRSHYCVLRHSNPEKRGWKNYPAEESVAGVQT